MNEQLRVRTERLRWHSRRALLELDLVLQRFWQRQPDILGEGQAEILERLLDNGRPRLMGSAERAAERRQPGLAGHGRTAAAAGRQLIFDYLYRRLAMERKRTATLTYNGKTTEFPVYPVPSDRM